MSTLEHLFRNSPKPKKSKLLETKLLHSIKQKKAFDLSFSLFSRVHEMHVRSDLFRIPIFFFILVYRGRKIKTFLSWILCFFFYSDCRHLLTFIQKWNEFSEVFKGLKFYFFSEQENAFRKRPLWKRKTRDMHRCRTRGPSQKCGSSEKCFPKSA